MLMIRHIAVFSVITFFASVAFAGDPLGVSQALGLTSKPISSSTVKGSAQPLTVGEGAVGGMTNAHTVSTEQPQSLDYRANLASDVFGASLFSGAFMQSGAIQFNEDYLIAIGDQLQVRLWGAFDYDAVLTVDPKGNVFIPQVGPISLLGVKNKHLQKSVSSAVGKIFKNNVNSYASLAAAHPVRVFVSGFVARPGLYSGTSLDSLLHYIDQAGGIDPERGSFLSVEVRRGDHVRAKVNLYDFLLKGRIPQIQLADSDVILVNARKNIFKVSGLAENAKRFEFETSTISLDNLSQLAKPLSSATHVRITRNTGSTLNVEYYALAEGASVFVNNGDELAFTADKKPGTITVRVEGEHLSPQEYVLPYGSRMADLLNQIAYSERSDQESLQLFRLSVKSRQKQSLQSALKSLETAVLTARSETSDEAVLRTQEAALVLQWIERAKTIDPMGQVIIAKSANRDHLLLESGDVIKVPSQDGLVLVSGEVLFPTAIAYDQQLAMNDYIKLAGGYTQSTDSNRVIIAKRDGSFSSASDEEPRIQMGDEILVLPKVDMKSVQMTKDLTQILYQIAVSAKVVLGL